VVRTADGLARKLPSASLPPRQTAAATNPDAADDSTLGYGAGSRWINTASGQIFNCLSAAAGAAVWAALDAADTPGPIANGLYAVAPQVGGVSLVGAADLAYAVLLLPGFLASVNAIGPRIITGGGAGSAFKAALLPHDPATSRPGATALAANNAGTASTGIGAQMGSLAAAAQIVPGRPVWLVGVFSAATPLPTVFPPAGALLTLSQQLGLGIPQTSTNSQPTGYSTPFPFANDIGAPNAFLGATWTPVNGANGVNWIYRVS
ncbi:MAG: hypothetical protein K2X74_04150, partial [Acetobacteraceae bacterium]|nr:hypothetical protein [Acetobacteraceae bacterium]